MAIEHTTLLIGAVTVEGMLWGLKKDAYKSGLEGAAGYPLDIDAEIAVMEAATGRKLKPFGYETVSHIVDLLNREYEDGCKRRASIT